MLSRSQPKLFQADAKKAMSWEKCLLSPGVCTQTSSRFTAQGISVTGQGSPLGEESRKLAPSNEVQ